MSTAINDDFFLEHCFCDKEYNEDECLGLDTPIGKINRFDTNFEIAYECDDDENITEEELLRGSND